MNVSTGLSFADIYRHAPDWPAYIVVLTERDETPWMYVTRREGQLLGYEPGYHDEPLVEMLQDTAGVETFYSREDLDVCEIFPDAMMEELL